jgi:hypothetical protein
MSNQCPYLRPRDERKFLCCELQAGHEGHHRDGYGHEGDHREWVLPEHYRCTPIGRTALEVKLARIVIELCIAAGHPEDGSRSSVPAGPAGKCACELVPPELVPEEYR